MDMHNLGHFFTRLNVELDLDSDSVRISGIFDSISNDIYTKSFIYKVSQLHH